jgi:cell division protein FtsB
VSDGKAGSGRSALTGRRLLYGLVVAGILYFAIEGGEYGTVALIKQRFEKRNAKRAIDSLQRQVDSLSKVRTSLQTDPAVQEKIAREEFGMIKPKEILYRFAEPADSAKGKRKP